jgi:hypothetical protein
MERLVKKAGPGGRDSPGFRLSREDGIGHAAEMEDRTLFDLTLNAAIALNSGRDLAWLFPDFVPLRDVNAHRSNYYYGLLRELPEPEAVCIEIIRRQDLWRREQRAARRPQLI